MKMEEWKECKLKDICDYGKDRIEVSSLDNSNYISTENMLPNRAGITTATTLPTGEYTPSFEIDDTLVSNIRPYFKKIWKATFSGGCSADVLVFKAKENVSKEYLYYVLADDEFFKYSMATSKGTKMPRGDKTSIMNYPVKLPPLPTQQKIAAILSSLDDKIELNNKINTNLEQQAQALFKNWFVDFEPFGGKMPEGWKVGKLSEIADYLNGLAMKKFRPLEDEEGLPVLKIKEFRQGCYDESSELCSPSKVKPEYIIHDGDVIFSWSGSLLVDIWCGGTCGLNQHLFKVTSQTYEKWFYYLWTKHHLDRFIFLAADKATTMGHIKREELDKAEVVIPDDKTYSKLTMTLSPIIDTIINNRVENRRLSEIRDNLLPELMSGNINVEDITI